MCVCIYVYVCICVCIYIYIYLYIYISVYVCLCVYICMHACMLACIYVCMCICMYVCNTQSDNKNAGPCQNISAVMQPSLCGRAFKFSLLHHSVGHESYMMIGHGVVYHLGPVSILIQS